MVTFSAIYTYFRVTTPVPDSTAEDQSKWGGDKKEIPFFLKSFIFSLDHAIFYFGEMI